MDIILIVAGIALILLLAWLFLGSDKEKNKDSDCEDIKKALPSVSSTQPDVPTKDEIMSVRDWEILHAERQRLHYARTRDEDTFEIDTRVIAYENIVCPCWACEQERQIATA